MTGLEGDRSALVVVHHVLVDGVGGLTVLRELVDLATPTADEPLTPDELLAPFPRPAPRPCRPIPRHGPPLPTSHSRWRSLRSLSRWSRLLRRSWTAAGGVQPTRVSSRSCCGAPALAESWEWSPSTCPGGGTGPGNQVSPLLVAVPTSDTRADRLRHVGGYVRSQRAGATGPPPIAPLGGLFRVMARAGLYTACMNHQRRLHTVVTHVRGPRDPVRFAGCPVEAAIPVLIGDSGNVPGSSPSLVRRDAGHLGDHRSRSFPRTRRADQRPWRRA